MAATDPRLKKRGTKQGRDVWSALIDLPVGPDGRRRRHRFSFAGNKTEAAKALVRRLADIGNGAFVEPDGCTFGEYLVQWLESARGLYAAKTWERFDSLARVHLIPDLGTFPLQRLSTAHLNRAYSHWRTAGLSGQTVLHHHRLIHRILAQATREGRVIKNVASTAERPRAEKREARHLVRAEIACLMRAASGGPFEHLIMLALATGARRGELLAVRWLDLNLERSTLAIRRSLEQMKSGVREKSTKSGQERVINLPPSAVAVLRKRRERLEPLGPQNSYIFPGPDGMAWSPHNVTEGFRALCKRVGIHDASFHSLRHTAATQMLELQVPPKVVQERLGHSTIAITMDLYSHATPSLQADAAQRLESALGPLLEECRCGRQIPEV